LITSFFSIVGALHSGYRPNAARKHLAQEEEFVGENLVEEL